MDVKHTSACASAHGLQILSFLKSGRCGSNCSGTSLMDVMTTLAVASVLFGAGIPGFQHYLASSRLVSNTNLVSRSLMLTRSEAVKRETDVVICKSQDQQTCNSEASWHQGWIIYEDRQPNRQRDDDEPLIFAHSALSAAVQLDYRAFRSSNFIAFRPTGITKTNGTFTLCYNEEVDSARALILSKTGRVRFSRNRADGSPLSCPPDDG